MPQPSEYSNNAITLPHCLARALYDNIPDSLDELAFRKGDHLIVLEQNTANIEGWWLCSLRGRQGICPANRLRLLPGVYEDNADLKCHPTHISSGLQSDVTSLQVQGKRRSWHVQPNQVVTPRKFNDVYLYDMPPHHCTPVPSDNSTSVISMQQSSECYDVPPRAVPVPNLSPCSECSPYTAEAYDIPRPLHNAASLTYSLTPSSSSSSLTSSSNRSSVATMASSDYDVPRRHYDIPPGPAVAKELPLELNSALETLQRLEGDVTSSIGKLLSFVGPGWRQKNRLDNTVLDIKLAAVRFRASLQDLTQFSEGTLGNAAKCSDRNLAQKLSTLVASLKRADELVSSACDRINNDYGWQSENLKQTDDSNRIESNGANDQSLVIYSNDIDDTEAKMDALNQLIACARSLTEDVRQIASFIQGNGLLLFKKAVNPPATNWFDEYDYVRLETQDKNIALQNKNGNASADLCTKNGMHKQPMCNMTQITTCELKPEERQVICFFGAQLITHQEQLTHAIDEFLRTVEHNQPPKVFLAYGKFVVLSAHKLVHIGDSVHRNVHSSSDLKHRTLQCANALADALTHSVTKTKMAAMQFPSVTAVQDMVDSIVDISYAARDLKLCVVQASTF